MQATIRTKATSTAIARTIQPHQGRKCFLVGMGVAPGAGGAIGGGAIGGGAIGMRGSFCELMPQAPDSVNEPVKWLNPSVNVFIEHAKDDGTAALVDVPKVRART